MIWVGTSGFSYDDWRGEWYPPRLARGRMFDFYAERFAAIEVNSTFYHIYRPQMMASLVRRAAGRVRFAVKMTAFVTHERELGREVVVSYSRGIEPAAEAGVLSAVLLQFPMRFRESRENREYLQRALAAFASFPLVAEIRHRSWQSAEGMRFFKDHGINLCLMDMPRLRGLPEHSLELTGNIFYLRFHGRNAGQWFRGEYPGARYDYDYSEEELAAWAEPAGKLARKAESALAFFNNHVRGQAPRNAMTFMNMIGQRPTERPYEDLFTPERAARNPGRHAEDYSRRG